MADEKASALTQITTGLLDTDELIGVVGTSSNFRTPVANVLQSTLRHNAAQSLSAGQKAQALSNLGIMNPIVAAIIFG